VVDVVGVVRCEWCQICKCGKFMVNGSWLMVDVQWLMCLLWLMVVVVND
jgi:hypothetical protein